MISFIRVVLFLKVIVYLLAQRDKRNELLNVICGNLGVI